MENEIFRKLFPVVEEKYLERAFERLKAGGCPEGEDLPEWFAERERSATAPSGTLAPHKSIFCYACPYIQIK